MKNLTVIFIFIVTIVSNVKAQNWQLQLQRSNLELSDLHFLNNNEGFAFGDSVISGAFIASVTLKTADGGLNWSTYTLSNSSYRIAKVYPLNSNELFAIGRSGGGNDGLFLKSNDGGLTWNTPGFFNERLNGVYFKDAVTGWVMGKNGLFSKTTDGGITWTSQSLTSENIMNMKFYNPTIGIICCDGGELYRTTDGGNTWLPVISNAGNALIDISISGAYSWICGEAGTVIHSSDFGLTWSAQSGLLPVDYGVISFPNNSGGWTAGISGTMFSTTNGGLNWQSVVSGSASEITGLSVPDINHGWYCNEDGEIYFFDLTTSINEVNQVDNLTLFPNPSFGNLNIASKTRDEKTLFIMNSNSQILRKIQYDGSPSINIDCSDLNAGKYFILESDTKFSQNAAVYSFIKM